MKPQYQLEEDDCWRACVASILELPTAEVPHFVKEYSEWMNQTWQWLGNRGFEISWEDYTPGQVGYNIVLCEDGPRPMAHAVIYFGDEQIHCPGGKHDIKTKPLYVCHITPLCV